jgi:putative FmdB family regulatory protein
MPIYPYSCDVCKNKWEIRLTMSEHDVIKNIVKCSCGGTAHQLVASLNFRLQGEGWVGRDGGNNAKGIGYEMTQREMDKSKEDVAKMDDYAAEMSIKDLNRSEF